MLYFFYFRLRFKRDFRVIVRCLSDKPSEGDGKLPKTQKENKDDEKESESSTDKIQALLKSMMNQPLTRETEYRANFTSAPDIRGQRKRDRSEVKAEKIGNQNLHFSDNIIMLKMSQIYLSRNSNWVENIPLQVLNQSHPIPLKSII